jgi:hypothetical protein
MGDRVPLLNPVYTKVKEMSTPFNVKKRPFCGNSRRGVRAKQEMCQLTPERDDGIRLCCRVNGSSGEVAEG